MKDTPPKHPMKEVAHDGGRESPPICPISAAAATKKAEEAVAAAAVKRAQAAVKAEAVAEQEHSHP